MAPLGPFLLYPFPQGEAYTPRSPSSPCLPTSTIRSDWQGKGGLITLYLPHSHQNTTMPYSLGVSQHFWNISAQQKTQTLLLSSTRLPCMERGAREGVEPSATSSPNNNPHRHQPIHCVHKLRTHCGAGAGLPFVPRSTSTAARLEHVRAGTTFPREH